MTRVAAAVATVLALGFAPAADAAKQSPAGTVKLGSTSTAQLARTGKVAVRVGYPLSGRVRVFVTLRGSRTGFARARSVRLRKRGSKRIVLRLTAAGRRAAAARSRDCRPLRLTLRTRGQRYVLRRVHPSPFSQRNRVGRQRNRTRAFSFPAARSCRAAGPSRPGAAPGGPASPPAPLAAQGGGDPAAGGLPGSRLKAAASSTDITPPVGTPMFAYTARSGLANPPNALQILGDPDENLYAKSFVPSEGIHARVRSHALVLERDGKRYALVSVDLGGVPFALIQEVAERIAGTGIDTDRMLVSATHTHSSTGPIWPIDSFGYQLLGGDVFDPRAFDLTAEGIAQSIRDAAGRLEPARMGVAATDLRGASRNRNFDPFRRNPDVPADEAGAREASVNPSLTAVRVDRTDGAPIGVWSNFAIHPTNFGDDNLNFSGDNLSTAVRDAEAAIAAERPGGAKPPVAVFANSAQGDISPDGGSTSPDGEPLEYTPTAAASANLAGRRVAVGIVRAWREAGQSMGDGMAIDARRTYTSFAGTTHDGEPVGPIPALGQGGIVSPDGTCNPLDVPGQGKKLPALAGPGLVPAGGSVSLWRIGSLGIAGYPSEITKQMGVRITDALRTQAGGPLSSVALAGLSNGYVSYTATPEEYDACHYEGSFTLFGRRQGAAFLDASRPLVGPLLSGAPAPAGALEPPSLAFSAGPAPTLRATPDAGDPIGQPAATVTRHGQVSFKWKGGDPQVDAARGSTFVSLQRQVGGDWRTVGSDDGVSDTTVFDDADDSWTETWQFGTCDPLGRYRFVVTGRSVESAGAEPADYTVTSDEFELGAIPALQTIDSQVTGSKVRVRARYPDPGQALLALPRRVRDGEAQVRLAGGQTVTARPDADRLGFEADVPAGATVDSVSVADGCGNG